MDLFKKETFTTTELNLIAEALDNPTVKKYFNNEMTQSFAAIAEGEPEPDETPDNYLRRVAKVQGSIAVFKALLSIKKVEQVQEDNS